MLRFCLREDVVCPLYRVSGFCFVLSILGFLFVISRLSPSSVLFGFLIKVNIPKKM